MKYAEMSKEEATAHLNETRAMISGKLDTVNDRLRQIEQELASIYIHSKPSARMTDAAANYGSNMPSSRRSGLIDTNPQIVDNQGELIRYSDLICKDDAVNSMMKEKYQK